MKTKNEKNWKFKKEPPITRHTHPNDWSSYMNAKRRCYYKSHDSYPWYGAKGIKLSYRWYKSFPRFVLDMGPKPSKEHVLHRKNSKKNYSLRNCVYMEKHEHTLFHILEKKEIMNKKLAKNLRKYVLCNNKTVNELCTEFLFSYSVMYKILKDLTWKETI